VVVFKHDIADAERHGQVNFIKTAFAHNGGGFVARHFASPQSDSEDYLFWKNGLAVIAMHHAEDVLADVCGKLADV
jgi:hypothetical protein